MLPITRRACLGVTLATYGCRKLETSSSIVRVAAILGSPWLFVMESLGLFRQHGINVQLNPIGSTGKIAQALIGGSVDIAFAALDQVIQLSAQAKHIRMFVTTSTQMGTRLYAAAGASSPVRTVADLKGRKVGIATFGSSIDFQVGALLQRHGMTVSDVERIPTGSLPAAFAALESGKVDAAALNTFFGMRYERRHPDAPILMDMMTSEGARRTLGVDSYPMGLIAQTSWLDRNRELASGIARAFRAYSQWTAEHTPEQIREATPSEHRSGDVSADVDYWTVMKGIFTRDGSMPVNAPQQVRDIVAVMLPVVRSVDLSQTWTDAFATESR